MLTPQQKLLRIKRKLALLNIQVEELEAEILSAGAELRAADEVLRIEAEVEEANKHLPPKRRALRKAIAVKSAGQQRGRDPTLYSDDEWDI